MAVATANKHNIRGSEATKTFPIVTIRRVCLFVFCDKLIASTCDVLCVFIDELDGLHGNTCWVKAKNPGKEYNTWPTPKKKLCHVLGIK